MVCRMVRRRGFFGLVMALSACGDSGPEQADALAQIAARIRAPYQMGEKRLSNLTFKSMTDLGGGRYAVFVDYDLISTMPELGLFSTTFLGGSTVHMNGERYVFTRSDVGWKIE
jgi:NADH:ubiquinone oxidoreductase subunit H